MHRDRSCIRSNAVHPLYSHENLCKSTRKATGCHQLCEATPRVLKRRGSEQAAAAAAAAAEATSHLVPKVMVPFIHRPGCTPREVCVLFLPQP